MLNIRKYRSGDEEGFHKLDRELEEHPYNRRSISNYIWKFKGKNPFGKSVSYFSTNKKKNNCTLWSNSTWLVHKK